MKKILPLLLTAAVALAGSCVALSAQHGTTASAAAGNAAVELGQDAFAVNMFRDVVAQQKGNVVFSPASLEKLLALLEKGARGQTLAALQAAPTGSKGVQSAMQVESADALFVADDLKLKPVDVQDIRTVSFTKLPEAVSAINGWCRDKTHGLIPELVTVNSLTPHTRMVALNAVYLKEKWLNPFNKKRTETDGTFRTPDGTPATVAMMHQSEKYRYAEGDDWQAVALDYDTCGRKGEPGFFIGILPKGDAREFAASLTPEKYRGIRQALADAPYGNVFVSLPKMDVETPAFSLNKPLEAHGLGILFRGADFSGFADERLVVDSVIQRCHVMVDEEKTEAAAATAAIMVRSVCRQTVIRFDRPFLWAIDDLSTASAPYFMGLYEKP